MKKHILGRVNGDTYDIVAPSGEVMKSIPLAEARNDTKVKAAIERNGWETIA